MISNRRNFLRMGASLPMAGAASLPASLCHIGNAAAQSASSDDYKALVCIYMAGGADYANTLVPFDDTSYAAYQSYRTDIAIKKQELIDKGLVLNPTVPLNQRAFALAPTLAPLLPKFQQQRMAVLLNIGTLIKPLTKSEFNQKKSNRLEVPFSLFAHDDQRRFFLSTGQDGLVNGWGGRISDHFLDQNTEPALSCVSMGGISNFLNGQRAFQFIVPPAGPTVIRPAINGNFNMIDGMGDFLLGTSGHMFEQEYVQILARSMATKDVLVNGVTEAIPNATTYSALRPASNDNSSKAQLGKQLAYVARMIKGRQNMGLKRQVFFCEIGGWDLHSSLSTNHPTLLDAVGSCMAAFDDLAQEWGFADQVTQFTSSEFGRTLSGNGDGSDHGWGSMHFVLGGAVNGGRYYGKPPVIGVNTVDDVGAGILLPTTSVDQMAWTLARWMGVADADQAQLLPHLSNFAPEVRDLGFMRSNVIA